MPALPTGTVTFLLTDVEGSTRLWEQQPDAMRQALRQHDTLVDEHVTRHGGLVVKPRGEGDSRFAVFARATDAVASAAALQVALTTAPWPAEAPLRVRVALHTGEADLRDGDYYGATVNRCARLRAVALGGQTLLTHATCELVKDTLPPGAVLRDLGERRLRDISRPERVFELVHDAEGARPLPSLDLLPDNLPVAATPFVGRERELEALRDRLARPDVRLLTLTGPGGTGKTRLALELAALAGPDFPDGVYFVPLAAVTDPALVGPSIAYALGVRETERRSTLESLVESLTDRPVLLVLDNFEHVISAAPLVSALYTGCPRLKLVVTSRAVLRLSGEHDFLVPPLSLPESGDALSHDRLVACEAVRLFAARAEAADARFALTADNAPAVAEICRRLDGLPLAIELAAVRTRFLPPRALLTRLERRLPLLEGGARDVSERHQTLRGAIAWSHDLLDPPEKVLFRRLAVFVGGCTLEAAEVVCGAGEPPVDVFRGLASLIDKSLIRQDEVAGVPWFAMLETIREYAVEQLEASGEQVGARGRHVAYVRAMVPEAHDALVGADQTTWLARLEAEHGNVRTVLGWAVDQEEAGLGLELCGWLWRFWWMRGYLAEGRQWLGGILGLRGAVRHPARGMALVGAGLISLWQGSYAPARTYLQESLAIGRERGDTGCAAYALAFLSRVARDQGDESTARTLGQQAVELFRQIDDPWGLAVALHFLGLATVRMDAKAARPLFEESASLFHASANEWDLAMPLRGLGLVAYHTGDPAAARPLFEESLGRFRARHDAWSEAMLLYDLAHVARAEREPARASTLFETALALWQQVGNSRGVGSCLAGLAALAAQHGDAERAARLLGAAETARAGGGGVFEPTDRAAYDESVDAVRSALGEAGFVAALAAGRVQTPLQALTCAPVPMRSTSMPEQGAVLTRREREVARLVARGLTNREIADALVITEGTAINHLSHILGKLGFRSRTQVAAWAVERRL